MSGIGVDPPGATHAGGTSMSRHFSSARVWALALLAGLIAGCASWLIQETLHKRYDSMDLRPPGHRTSPEMMSALFKAQRAAQTLEATLAFGTLGAVLGLALGLAGGSARGSVRAASSAAVVGSILGGLAGGALTEVMMPIYYRVLNPDTNDLAVGMMIHVVISSAIGTAAGAAFGVGLGDRRQAGCAVLGGLLGAVVGALVHQMVGAGAFPFDAISRPISATWRSRLFAQLAVTILASVGVALAVNQGEGARAKPVSAG